MGYQGRWCDGVPVVTGRNFISADGPAQVIVAGSPRSATAKTRWKAPHQPGVIHPLLCSSNSRSTHSSCWLSPRRSRSPRMRRPETGESRPAQGGAAHPPETDLCQRPLRHARAAGARFLQGEVRQARRRCSSSSTAAAGSAGDKSGMIGASVANYLAAGISVVSINYRYSWQAQIAGVKPPVNGRCTMRRARCSSSAARRRNGTSTSSASARAAVRRARVRRLWLAFHEDMADPKSNDPDRARIHAALERRGGRRADFARSAATEGMDAQQPLRRPRLRFHGPGRHQDRATRASRSFSRIARKCCRWIKEYSPIEHVTADDSADLPDLHFRARARPGAEGPDAHGELRREAPGKAARRSVCDCELVYPGAPDVKHADATAFLIADLKGPPRRTMKPTLADVRYGPHERQVLDFYQAKSDKPTPLLFFIHGGGWMAGDKNGVSDAARISRPASRWCRSTIASSPRPTRTVVAAGERPAARRGARACNSSAARPRSGTSTSSASARAAARRARAPRSGSRFIPTWPIRRARSRRARIHAAVVRRGERRADHARSRSR